MACKGFQIVAPMIRARSWPTRPCADGEHLQWQRRQGGITKGATRTPAGCSLKVRHYITPPKVSQELSKRQEGHSPRSERGDPSGGHSEGGELPYVPEFLRHATCWSTVTIYAPFREMLGHKDVSTTTIYTQWISPSSLTRLDA